MSMDADLFADQVELAYNFMETLHGQALALIKDVERQLAEAPERLRTVRPGGYRFAVEPLSMALENPQPILVNYYAVCFREFKRKVKNTPLDKDVPPIAFLKVVLRERNLRHPEVRFGVITEVEKPAARKEAWPKKFEDLVNYRVSQRALADETPWSDRGAISKPYEDRYISMSLEGSGVRLAEIPDSEAIAERIVEPLLAVYRRASGGP